jgi:hypothetical protein
MSKRNFIELYIYFYRGPKTTSYYQFEHFFFHNQEQKFYGNVMPHVPSVCNRGKINVKSNLHYLA